MMIFPEEIFCWHLCRLCVNTNDDDRDGDTHNDSDVDNDESYSHTITTH
jgi:hypothetical protein